MQSHLQSIMSSNANRNPDPHSQQEKVIVKSLSKVLLIVILMASTTASFGQAADNYKAKCAMCHGTDGAATTNAGKMMKTPPTTDAAFKASDADLFAATKNGKGKMPAFNGKLTDPQIKELITYMKSLK